MSDSVTINGTTSGDFLDGSSQADTINGGGGGDAINGGAGADVLNGGGGNDRFLYNLTDLAAGETINGGSGTDTIIVVQDGTYDFATAILSGVEDLSYANTASIVILAASQIGGAGGISLVSGTAAINGLDVVGGSVDLSGVTFSGWTGTTDTITANGDANANTITGTGFADALNGLDGDDTLNGGLGADILTGGDGADTLNGGGGNDVFLYTRVTDFAAGETVNGGAGNADTIEIDTDLSFANDFSAGTVTGVERLVFGTAANLVLAGNQIGAAAGEIHSVTGSSGVNGIEVAGSLVDLSGVTFANWAAPNFILISGTPGNDTLTGSAKDDQFELLGPDAANGGAGNDIFDVIAIEGGGSINGGAGKDILAVEDGTHDFTGVAVSGIERLLFNGSSAAPDATFSGDQIGGASDLQTVESGTQGAILQVEGSAIDISGVKFVNWQIGNEFFLDGTSGGDTLTGSAKGDVVNGFNGDDTLNSGGGNDLIDGGNGDDTMNGGSGVDDLRGESGKDTMTGGTGADFFDFFKLTDSVAGSQRDVITDFAPGSDQIDLRDIDADTSTAGDDDFIFIGRTGFGGHAGELRYGFNKLAGITIISGDVDGDGKADFQIELTGLHTLAAGDFFL